MLGVHPITVARYFDQGILAGHRTGGGHRRVSRAALTRYMRRQAIAERRALTPRPTSASEGRRSYSTVGAARVLGVHRFTVARYLDHGVLKGYRTAGGHRRVGPEELARHLRVKGRRVPAELAVGETKLRLLVVEADLRAQAAITRAFRRHASVAVTLTDSGVEAVLLAHGLRPDGMLIDVAVADFDAFALCRGLLTHPALKGLRVAMIAERPGPAVASRALAAGACALFGKPIEAAAVLIAIRQRRVSSSRASSRGGP